MSTSDPAAPSTPDPAAEAERVAPEPQVTEQQVEVEIHREVRLNRLLIIGAVLGAAIAAIACLFFPIDPEAEYTMSQIVGFMALIGAAIGAAVGGVVGLVLHTAVKRKRGSAIATQADVR